MRWRVWLVLALLALLVWKAPHDVAGVIHQALHAVGVFAQSLNLH